MSINEKAFQAFMTAYWENGPTGLGMRKTLEAYEAAKEQSAKTAHCTEQPVELADALERAARNIDPEIAGTKQAYLEIAKAIIPSMPEWESSAVAQAPAAPADLVRDIATKLQEIIDRPDNWGGTPYSMLAKAAAQVAARWYGGRQPGREVSDDEKIDAIGIMAKAIHNHLHRPDLGGRTYEDDPIKDHHQAIAGKALFALLERFDIRGLR